MEIQQSPAGKFATNLCGRGADGEGWIIKPTHWTTYDPTPSFSAATFLDPTITKFCFGGREMDLVPGGTEKLCDCPGMYFIAHELKRFDNFLDVGSDKINKSLDSMVQAIDLAVRLGFRDLYMLGSELIIRPSQSQIEFARRVGVDYDDHKGVLVEEKVGGKDLTHRSDLLIDFAMMTARKSKIDQGHLYEQWSKMDDREGQYGFSEQKHFASAVRSDKHYWERVQFLRLARKNLALIGVTLVSCTPNSRLNAWFQYRDPLSVCEELKARFGDPVKEVTFGKYQTRKYDHDLPHHRDIPPYGQKEQAQRPIKGQPPKPLPPKQQQPVALQEHPVQEKARELLAQNIEIEEVV